MALYLADLWERRSSRISGRARQGNPEVTDLTKTSHAGPVEIPLSLSSYTGMSADQVMAEALELLRGDPDCVQLRLDFEASGRSNVRRIS